MNGGSKHRNLDILREKFRKARQDGSTAKPDSPVPKEAANLKAAPDALETTLIRKALRKDGACGQKELDEFRGMHAGIREFRMRNFIDTIWTEGSWRAALERGIAEGSMTRFDRAMLISDELLAYRHAVDSLKAKLGVPNPTKAEMLEAIVQESELTPLHRRVLEQYYQTNGASRLAINNDDGDFRYHSIYRFRNDYLRFQNPDYSKRYWQKFGPNIVCFASAVQKLYWGRALQRLESYEMETLGRAESRFEIMSMLVREALYNDRIGSFLKKTFNDAQDQIFTLAKESRELGTLAFFTGDTEETTATIGRSRCISQTGRDHAYDGKLNMDAVTTIDISRPWYSGDLDVPLKLRQTNIISIDAVFDGVGSNKGSEIASAMAKEVLELSALAGWLRDPEDVRLSLLLAHLAIAMEAEKEELRSMATTAAVTFISNGKAYGIHCGDSSWKVLRGGEAKEQANLHSGDSKSEVVNVLGGDASRIEIDNSNEWVRGVMVPAPDGIGLYEKYTRKYDILPGDVIVTCTDGIDTSTRIEGYETALKTNGGNVPAALKAVVGESTSYDDLSLCMYVVPGKKEK